MVPTTSETLRSTRESVAHKIFGTALPLPEGRAVVRYDPVNPIATGAGFMSLEEHDGVIASHRAYYTAEWRAHNAGRVVTPGNQHLVQLLKGGFLGEDLRDGTGKTALDVGCGPGFNCVSLSMLGFETSGCEIDPAIVEQARANLEQFGAVATISVGQNESLPYPNAAFDFLIAMNVIHYVSSRSGVERTVAEYARVLKPGGRIYLTTNHPRNWVLAGSEPLGDSVWRVHVPGDYRDGLAFYVFEDADSLQSTLAPHFVELRTGENRFDFFSRAVRNLTVTGTRSPDRT